MKPNSQSANSIQIDFFYRPGRYWTCEELAGYSRTLNQIAADCFRQVPKYQSLTGLRSEFERTVITLATMPDGEAIGFCSAVVLEMDDGLLILHLGLTCVKKKARSLGLTHLLTSKLILRYLIRTSPFKRIWISNVACVLSSLGNIALHFDNVFPSPYGKQIPSSKHLRIARVINRHYRAPIAINKNANFDEDSFVFRGSVNQTVFQKSAKDTRYYHRDPDLSDFYLKRLNFKNGDEVIQIGQIGLISFPRYALKRTAHVVTRWTTVPIQRLKTNLFTRKP